VTQENVLERLKNKIRIDLVFRKGKAIQSGSLVVHYFIPEGSVEKTHVGVGVPKKSGLNAYRRNRIKRQIWGVIRQREGEILSSFSHGFFMLLYKGKSVISSKNLSLDFQGLLRDFNQSN
jgi:ribonuclease P protein component